MRASSVVIACVAVSFLFVTPVGAAADAPGSVEMSGVAGSGTPLSRSLPEAGELSGTVTLSGAWALYPMAVRWAEEFRKVHPNVRMDIGAGGAGKGMADALAGIVDLGMVSRQVYPAEVERGAWWVSVTRDAVVPVVSAENPALEQLLVDGLRREDFRSVWVAESASFWDEICRGAPAAPIRAYTRSDACGAAQTWASYLGATQEELMGVGVYGDPGLAEAIRRDALGIGFNNINYAYDAVTGRVVTGLAIVPIDLDGSGSLESSESFYDTMDGVVAAIADGRYPSPPSRDLHLVSRGVPERPEVIAFLRWILTDGQRFVREAGYIRLSDERLASELERLLDADPAGGTGRDNAARGRRAVARP